MTNTNDIDTGKISSSNLGIIRLTAFSVGSTLASGVFSISGDMAAAGAHTAAVLVGWLICGIGMYNLMMCFYELNRVRPDLTSGIFSYAKEGFGDFIGFNSAWGYWISAVLANVSFATLLFAAIGYFFPVFGEGNNLASIIGASIVIWITVLIVLRGVGQAATVNLIIVIAKVMPILVLLVAIVFARGFQWDIFMDNFFGDENSMPFFDQIKATIYTTVWVFIGVEGAVVISGRAKDTRTAGRAAVISFFSLLALYLVISIMSMGVMTTAELAELGNPPMAGVLEHVVGPWGAALVNFAVIISIGGATYTYTMLSAESGYAPAVQKFFPKVFAIENKNGAPAGSLIISTLIVQLFLIIVLFNESTYQIIYTISASMIMVPYLLSAAYYLKLKFKGENLEASGSGKFMSWMYALLGTVYGAWLLYASGLEYVLIMTLLYGPGILVYIWSRKQAGEKAFSKPVDKIVLVALLALFVLSIVLLVNGTIKPF